MNKSAGFTLLEIIISVAILAFISVFTASSIQNAIKYKAKTINKIEETAYIQDALKVMAEDIRTAFNYKDINIELFNLAQDERKKRAEEKNKKKNDTNKKTEKKPGEEENEGEGESKDEQKQDPQTQTEVKKESQKNFEKKEEKTITYFLGENEKLSFTCLCNSRSIENDPFSDQAEISYYIQDCRGRLDKRQRSRCLWRRISPVIDSDLEEGGTARVLLENVESLKFQYIGPDSEEEWLKTWMSNESGDAISKNKFPYAVEISLEVKPDKENAKPIAMTIVAPISFPNNQKTTKERIDEQNSESTAEPTKKKKKKQ
ncbi:MAG: prepilin-type N-terminal cleavage/methylation domain-containing protein [Bdellovibrionales bacterium]|nr:prepilin-type N-terminal cleavage/methylation domain-containing protein [Bdellovibrionales bacterium]